MVSYKLPYSDKELMQMIPCTKMELEMFKLVQKNTLVEAALYKRKFFKKSLNILGISGSRRMEGDCPKANSVSEWLLEQALFHARKLGAKTKIAKLRDYVILPCKGCYSTTNNQCHFYCSCYPKGTKDSDDMTDILYDQVLWADAIIFATPVNSFKISSLLSLWIDRAISLDGSLSPANPYDAKNRELNTKHTKFINLAVDSNVFGSGFLRRFTGKVAGAIVTGHEIGASMTISSLFMTLNHYGMLFPPFSNMYAIGNVCLPTYTDEKNLETDCYVEQAKQLAENVVNAVKLAKQNPKLFWKYNQGSN